MDIKDIEKRIIEVAKKKSSCEYSELSSKISYEKLAEKLKEFKFSEDMDVKKDCAVSVLLESVLLANLSGADLEKDIEKKFEKIFEKLKTND